MIYIYYAKWLHYPSPACYCWHEWGVVLLRYACVVWRGWNIIVLILQLRLKLPRAHTCTCKGLWQHQWGPTSTNSCPPFAWFAWFAWFALHIVHIHVPFTGMFLRNWLRAYILCRYNNHGSHIPREGPGNEHTLCKHTCTCNYNLYINTYILHVYTSTCTYRNISFHCQFWQFPHTGHWVTICGECL